MDLVHNEAAPMTRWLVASGALSSPFVLLDVGVQGGIASHWAPLLDAMKVYGFDLLEEAIAPLRQAGRPSDRYFATALGDRDGECEILLCPNTFETRFWDGTDGPKRLVPVRRLDTLLAQGEIELANFMKIDCEGYERYVLDGARNYLTACNMVGAEFESSFDVSRHYHRSRFVETFDPLVKHRLIVYGINFDRADKPSYIESLKTRRNGIAVPGTYSRPNTLNVLLSRDLVAERDGPSNYAFRPPETDATLDTLIKTMIVMELYGLVDRAYDILEKFQSKLGQRIDVEKAKNLLIPYTIP